MEAEFWHERWERKQLGFHEQGGNTLFAEHFDKLGLPPRSRVFLPLCGKTRDIARLLSQGFRVAGAELSATAIEQLFDDLGVEPSKTDHGTLTRYSAPDPALGIDIFVGDIFDLSKDMLGSVDAIYDRAALVAFPETMRASYTGHVAAITKAAPQFLICFDYDQRAMEGPPFSVPKSEVRALHGARYDIKQAASVPVAGRLKGKCEAMETAWLLRPKS